MGDILASLGRYKEAIEAYSKAARNIRNPVVVGQNEVVNWDVVSKPMLHAIHYDRGNAYAAMGNHIAAVKDFDRAMEFDGPLGHLNDAQVRYNRANSKFEVGQFDGAFDDYAAVNALSESSDTLLGMGNSKIMLGAFNAALGCYQKGVKAGSEDTQESCQNNAAIALVIRGVVDDQEYGVSCQGRDLRIEVSGLDVGAPGMIFIGYKGNVGNTPSAIRNAPGGEGYAGGRPFVVWVVPKPT